MAPPANRPWLSPAATEREAEILSGIEAANLGDIEGKVATLTLASRRIHEQECVNLNPATNVMNPRAEAFLAQGLGSRPSLGYPGEKYEMGLEAIEEIEVIAAHLVRHVFDCSYAEIRVPSGALANLFAFMATCQPGDPIIVPPASVGGHVTHHRAGAAGLFGLEIHAAQPDASRYSVHIDSVAAVAEQVRPKLITIGTSLNLTPHPVAELREIADSVGALLLFDAAHACGMIASGHWPNPLDEGAHLMTMSTYKSLGGPAGGLVLTNEPHLAERIENIAYPGLTANFDAAKSAALAITMLDWVEHGAAYGAEMAATAQALADALIALDVPVFATADGPTTSHQFAIDASGMGGGHTAALALREANLLACAIGLPFDGPTDGSGLRLGTPETTRWGMSVEDMPELAELIAAGLGSEPAAVVPRTLAFRKRFDQLHFVR